MKYHCFGIPKSHKLLTEAAGYKELLAPFYKTKHTKNDEWMHEDYEKNTAFPEFLIHKTSSGHLVRSKSEAIIDMALTNNNIPFRYECALYIGSKVIYPDFTIKHPATGEIILWEHHGKMDDPEYCQKTFSKLEVYASAGYIPGINLITTYETLQSPLNSEDVKKTIDYYFS